MPDPGRYKGEGAKKQFMRDCMRRNLQEGKEHDQAVAICLNMFRREKGGDKYPQKKKKALTTLIRAYAHALQRL